MGSGWEGRGASLTASPALPEVAAPWTDETVKQCLYLYLALLPQNHKLIHELAAVYTEAIADIKRTVLRVIEQPVRPLSSPGPAHRGRGRAPPPAPPLSSPPLRSLLSAPGPAGLARPAEPLCCPWSPSRPRAAEKTAGGAVHKSGAGQTWAHALPLPFSWQTCPPSAKVSPSSGSGLRVSIRCKHVSLALSGADPPRPLQPQARPPKQPLCCGLDPKCRMAALPTAAAWGTTFFCLYPGGFFYCGKFPT